MMRLVMVTLLGLVGLVHPTHAAEFSCAARNVACLIAAINAANASGEANTIALTAGTYTLTAVDNTTEGPNGLPSITGSLSITGAGAETTIIERAASAPPFRLLHVAPQGTLTLDGLTLQEGNLAGLADGGGVLNRGTLTVTHSLLRGHAASTGGGIFHSGSATLTLTHSALSSNTATGSSCQPQPQCGSPTGRGGGISSNGPLTISHSTVSGNTASSSSLMAAFGGGISSNGPLTISHSTVSGNTSLVTVSGLTAGSGGGIHSVGPLTISHSTVSGNASSGGGGITQIRDLLTLINSTVSGNTASSLGGGISITRAISTPPGQAILQNTILAGNTVPPMEIGPDCYYGGSLSGSITSHGHNLIGDPTGCNITFAAGDRTGDPGLGPFTDDGTPGHGHFPLLPDSPAIDAGDPTACPPTDQLGRWRVGPCDIGAVEFQATITEFVSDVYVAALARLPDASEVAYWVDVLTTIPTPDTVRSMLHVVSTGRNFASGR